MSANVQFGEVSGRPGDGRPGTSAPTIDGATGGVMCDGPGATDIDGATGGITRDGTGATDIDGATGGVVGDGPGGVMVGRDVLGAPPPPNGLCAVPERPFNGF